MESRTWIKLLSDDGYEVMLRSFLIDGEVKTIVMNNYSEPLSLHNFDTSKISIDDEWHNIYQLEEKQFPHYQDYELFKNRMSDNDFRTLEFGIEMFFNN